MSKKEKRLEEITSEEITCRIVDLTIDYVESWTSPITNLKIEINEKLFEEYNKRIRIYSSELSRREKIYLKK